MWDAQAHYAGAAMMKGIKYDRTALKFRRRCVDRVTWTLKIYLFLHLIIWCQLERRVSRLESGSAVHNATVGWHQHINRPVQTWRRGRTLLAANRPYVGLLLPCYTVTLLQPVRRRSSIKCNNIEGQAGGGRGWRMTRAQSPLLNGKDLLSYDNLVWTVILQWRIVPRLRPYATVICQVVEPYNFKL